MRKLILKNALSPGDIVLLTAAVRDLHRCYPGRFLTDVRTSCAELWMHNPYLTPLRETDPEVEVIPCEYPLIHQSNHAPYHCIHGFIDFLNARLGLQIRPTAFKGDLHLSAQEKAWISQVHELTGAEVPFWIIVAGGKYDVTIKWWDRERYQKVVDHFRDRVLFVQVGSLGHHHPRLNGVVDLRGRTDMRQLVRLVYHAQGVICPVTGLMHLAAAVEVKDPSWRHRPCVVVAGGREPVHWEAYPHHQFIHTLGTLSCCRDGGCWRSRTVPLGDGDSRDGRQQLCADVVNGLPQCMHMITAEEVIRRVEFYDQGGRLRRLTSAEQAAGGRAVRLTRDNPFDELRLSPPSAGLATADFLKTLPPYPAKYRGRGLLVCGGSGVTTLGILALVRKLRRLGSVSPVEFWHLGLGASDARSDAQLKALGVRCLDARVIRRLHPARRLREQELRAYALVHSRFREIILLSPDQSPRTNPECLFSEVAYRQCGAVFPRLSISPAHGLRWRWNGVDSRMEPIPDIRRGWIDKKRVWKALQLHLWLHEHSDFFHRRLGGSHGMALFAFKKVEQPFRLIG
ncbi:MAG TPA: glycosyltransferase family 9 protein [Candidatus Paceibacterota bacterium]|nr:glycosyltransferase family 9 protein [Verrucomicrobiota bacterium]HRY48777.1 glycosyltransferase family 9 protein [Candidatus Paceibacterota bacterium]HRZ99823.1 glycosyltransferase family 9 protein [Candidatus Paceibacterota bacterium]